MEYATNGFFEGYKAVDETKCTGCRKCVEVCPYGAFEFVGEIAIVTDECRACGACDSICPVKAIYLIE